MNKKLGINVKPPEIAEYAKKVGARKDCKNGTFVDVLIRNLKDKWGVKYIASMGHQDALKWLREGKWLIASIQNYPIGGKKIFTGGHLVVLYGVSGDRALMMDPYKTNIEFLPIENNRIKYIKSGNGFYYLYK